MRFLHTADWHVGKVLKGRSRLAEHEAVLAELAGVARRRRVDAVLVAGDLYESAVPGAAAQRLVVETLLDLREAGAEVVVVAGNHDHGPTLDAYRPLMAVAGIHLVGTPRDVADGGIVAFEARSTGEPVRVAALPFVSQHQVVTAARLVGQPPAAATARYARYVQDRVAALAGGFRAGAVNLLAAHLTVAGGVIGGGERPAQTVMEYHVPPSIFPARADYVALGHLHRPQDLRGPCPIRYAGAPIAVDFADSGMTPSVTVVDVEAGGRPRVEEVPLRAARRLRTVHGTIRQLRALAEGAALGPEGGAPGPEDLLRVHVREKVRAGLREEVAAILPNALEIRIDADFADPPAATRPAAGAQRGPLELFREYCDGVGVADERLATLFNRLHDHVTSPETTRGEGTGPGLASPEVTDAGLTDAGLTDAGLTDAEVPTAARGG